MDLANCTPSEGAQPSPQSAISTGSTSSPALSLFSRGHASRSSGSTSSLTSSPKARDSFDLFGNSKRLEDVREDPSERDEMEYEFLRHSKGHPYDDDVYSPARTSYDQSPPHSPPATQYSLGEPDTWSIPSSGRHHFKRHRSVDYPRSSMANRIVNRLPSLSKRWKHKSGTLPQLSIVTHMGPISSRTSSGASSQLISPALSAISKHESYLPSSSLRPSLDVSVCELSTEPITIEKEEVPIEDQNVQATTPLLPPVFTQLCSNEGPIQSPLQSPSVAAGETFPTTTPEGQPISSGLPSPPLSTKPSIASFKQRSRANTSNVSASEIPPLPMLDNSHDPWSQRLGHADFNIDPEPYIPEVVNLETYRDFRSSWDLARRNYAKHLARTGEHYGTTSKVYLLTQEKWNLIDDAWKSNNNEMTTMLSHALTNTVGQEAEVSDSVDSSTVLEKPVSRIVVPKLDDSGGKFPALGDEDIVGPMSVGPARSPTMQKPTEREWAPQSPRKRNFLKFLSDIFGARVSRE